jgi:DnaJ-class molecular chaperone
MTTTTTTTTSPPTTESEAYDALGLRRGADESEIKAKFRALALTTHPDAVSGDRERFRAIVRAKEILLRSSSPSSSSSSSWGGFTAAETAARRASENKLPRHFHGFVFATAAVLVGVAYVRTNAGDRKEARSPLVRHALGLPERKSADGGC